MKVSSVNKWKLLGFCLIMGGLAGIAVDIVRKKCGDYPEELSVVMGKVKNEKHYDYSKMGALMVLALIPLLAGASVGPEAGLTGIIVGICYWVGDNLKSAKKEMGEYSEISDFCWSKFWIWSVIYSVPGRWS